MSNDFVDLLAQSLVKVQKILQVPVLTRICPDALFHDAGGSFSKIASEGHCNDRSRHVSNNPRQVLESYVSCCTGLTLLEEGRNIIHPHSRDRKVPPVREIACDLLLG